MSGWHHNNHTISHCVWWVSDTTTIIQFHTVFDECLTPQQTYNFTLCLMSVWHHNKHTISHCVWWVSDTTTNIQFHTVFDECLTPQQSYNFTLCLMSVWHHNKHTISHCVWWVSDTTTNIQFHTVFDECLTPQQSYNFTLCLMSVWHHNNHAYLHAVHWASQQSYKFTLSLRSFSFAFTEHLALSWDKPFWFYLWWWNWKHYEQSSYSFFSFLLYNLCNLFCLCGYKLTQLLSFEHQSLENCGITSHCRGWGKNVIIQCLQFGPHAQITPCIRHSMCVRVCVYACARTHAN